MAWTSMHFAVGMCGGAALTLIPCLIRRRGFRLIPLGMTLGGLWGLAPDLPRIWREDFPSLPFASTLGDKALEDKLHSVGDLFFFHQSLDAQPKEFALLGLAIIIGLYNLSLLTMLMHKSKRAKGTSAVQPDIYAHRQTKHPRESLDQTASSPHPSAVVGRIRKDRTA